MNTQLVQSKKQLNTIVSVTKNNLVKQGVDVTRRQVEKAISPALSGGQSHEALSSRLKSEPTTTKGVAHVMIERADDSSVMLPKLSSVTSMLNESVSNLLSFNVLYRNYNNVIATALEKISRDNVPEPVIKAVTPLKDVISSGSPIEILTYSPSAVLERNDAGGYDEDVDVTLHIKNGKHEIYLMACVDTETNEVLHIEDVTINAVGIEDMGLSDDEVANTDTVMIAAMQYLISCIGFNVSISNEFTADISPELLKMLIAECS